MPIFVNVPKFIKIILIATACVLAIMTADSCKSRGPYNPYIKSKTKPSQTQMKADAKVVKEQNKIYKKQVGNNRKHLFGRRTAPGA